MARLASSRSKNQEQAEGSQREASRWTPSSGFTSGILELQRMTGNLATVAPLHPREVAKIIKDYWDSNYWTTDKKDKLADKLIKDAKLKKPAATTK